MDAPDDMTLSGKLAHATGGHLASQVCWWYMMVATMIGTAAGCRDSKWDVKPPRLHPDEAGKQAMELYDTDGNGALSKEELKQCPAIFSVMGKFDTDADEQVSGEEITAQLRSWETSGVGLTGAIVYFRLNGRPLEGASVELIPEPFLGDAVKPASGTTSDSGTLSPSLAAEDLPDGISGAMQYGLYKVKITHEEISIPAKYNEATELGLEVPPVFDVYNPPIINLKTKN